MDQLNRDFLEFIGLLDEEAVERNREPFAPVITFHESQMIQKATPQTLDSFEEEIGATLDNSYREFLLAGGGGRPQPSRIHFAGGSDLLSFIRGFESSRPIFDLRNGIAFFGDPKVSGYLMIAASQSGDCWLMKMTGTNVGAIFLWDHDLEEVEPVTFHHLTQLFGSFAEFMAAIH